MSDIFLWYLSIINRKLDILSSNSFSMFIFHISWRIQWRKECVFHTSVTWKLICTTNCTLIWRLKNVTLSDEESSEKAADSSITKSNKFVNHIQIVPAFMYIVAIILVSIILRMTWNISQNIALTNIAKQNMFWNKRCQYLISFQIHNTCFVSASLHPDFVLELHETEDAKNWHSLTVSIILYPLFNDL